LTWAPSQVNPGNIDIAPVSLPAAHGQHNGPGIQLDQSPFLGEKCDSFPLSSVPDIEGAAVEQKGHTLFPGKRDVALSILRTGQFFTKAVQPKSVVNALQQYPPGSLFTIRHQHLIDTRFFQSHRRRQTGRTGADHHRIV